MVLTCRQNVLVEALKAVNTLCESSLIRNRIELSSSKLTPEERLGIVEAMLDFYKCDKSLIDMKACCDNYKADIGFPYCSFLFAADKSLFAMKERFFERPYQFFKENLNALNKEVKASLLFLFYMQGQCSEKELKPSMRNANSENEMILLRISDLIGICDQEVSLSKVRNILLEMSGIYITHLNKAFRFAHNVVYECIALIHAEKYPEEVIENCTWDFINGCVVVSKTDSEAKMIIDCDLYENLCTRFIHETLDNRQTGRSKFYDIRNHKALQTRGVCVNLYQTLHKLGKLQEFLTVEMDGCQGGFLYRYLNNKEVEEASGLVEEAIPYLKCNCSVGDLIPCWKCHVKNDSARGACFGGHLFSFYLFLPEGITIVTQNIIDACRGGNPELLKLVITVLKTDTKFNPEAATKSLVIAQKSKAPHLYSVLRNEGVVVMPQCVFDAVDMNDFEMTKHFVNELKANGKWNITDFWLQHALERSVSFDNVDICNFLKQEGLSFHRGCLLSAVKSRQLSKVKDVVNDMKTAGTWQPADTSFETELQSLLNMMRTGNSTPINFRTLADVGISEALIKAKYFEDKAIYEFLLTEGVQLTMETLPVIVTTRDVNLVMEVVGELKSKGKWNPAAHSCAEAICKAIHQESQDIFECLVEQGIHCTMDILPALITEPDITLSVVQETVTLIKQFGTWEPNSISMHTALVEAFKKDESIFQYLIQCGATINTISVLTAVMGQDIDTLHMYLQILKSSPDWNPSDQLLNMCSQLSKISSPDIYKLLQDAGVGYSSQSLVQAAVQNDQIAMMMTINELIERKAWEPRTDSNITMALDLVCRHNNFLMFNVLQKKGARLSMKGLLNLIENCRSLFYSIGPEYRKPVKPVPSLAAMTVALIAKSCLIAAVSQNSAMSYIRIIHALEEMGKLDRDDPLLKDALKAAINSGSTLAYNTIADTGTEVPEKTILQLLKNVHKDLKIEVPERLLNRLYKDCLIQCLLACIKNGNIQMLDETTKLMKQAMLWCPNDQRIIHALETTLSSNKLEIIQKLRELKIIWE